MIVCNHFSIVYRQIIVSHCRHEVVSLVSHVKKVSVADLVENMEVQLSIHHQEVAKIYKLRMTLRETEFVPLENIHETLKTVFLEELEAAIENHVIFLSRVSGIKNFASSSRSEASDEADEDESGVSAKEADDDDADDDYDGGDDLGSDVQKRQQQATDEMDYEDNGSDIDPVVDELEKGKSDLEDIETREDEDFDDKDEASDVQNAYAHNSEAKSSGKSGKDKIRRAIYMEVKGLSFKAHFKFTTEPHVLLAQVFPFILMLNFQLLHTEIRIVYS